jgi:hypothetical protein
MSGNPEAVSYGWFPLIARPASPAWLLTFRYEDGLYLSRFHRPRSGGW